MRASQSADKSVAMHGPIRAIRRAVNRAGFDITRRPFAYRFVDLLQRQGVTDVLDVGANTGQFGETLRAARFGGRIISIEPLTAAFDQLQHAARGDAAWLVERAAVSDQAGTLTINVAGNSVSSSALPMLSSHSDAVPTSAYVATEEVTATTVDDVVSRHGVHPAAALLKLDVQGYEDTALAGATGTLPEFRMVQLELSLVPLYDGQALMPEMVRRMADAGLDLWLIEPAFVEPASGRMLQCDGTFVRRS